jgi:hypothetical protein
MTGAASVNGHHANAQHDPLIALAEVERLVGETGLDALGARLSPIREAARGPFRLAVVGALRRGKSHLVNRLAGTEAVPTTGTTIVPITVSPGALGLEVRRADGSVEHRRPEEDGVWSDLVGRRSPGHTGDTSARRRIQSAWLEELELELIDTPGLGEGPRTDAVLETADAFLLVLDASLPLGNDERTLLEGTVGAGRLDAAGVVVTRWERVDAGEREEVWEAIQEELSAISPALQVVADRDGNVRPVRTLVEDLVARAGGEGQRTRRRAWQVVDVLDLLAEALDARIEAESAGEEQRLRELADAERDLERRELDWDRVRIGVERRRLALADRLRERLATSREGIAETLMWELERASDVKKFWRLDLPHRLRRELRTAAKSLDTTLTDGLKRDLAWLDEGLGEQRRRSDLDPGGTGPDTPAVADVRLRDVERWKLYNRLGSGGAMLAASILFPPVAIAIGATAAVSGELTLRGMGEDQRRRLREDLLRTIDGATDEHARAIDERLTAFYDALLTDLDERATARAQARAEALRLPAPSEGGESASELRERARRLRGELIHGLERERAEEVSDDHGDD